MKVNQKNYFTSKKKVKEIKKEIKQLSSNNTVYFLSAYYTMKKLRKISVSF